MVTMASTAIKVHFIVNLLKPSICRARRSAANDGRVVATLPEHTVLSLPRSPPFAMQRGNRIHQREGFLRVVPIRAGQTHGERHASPVANQMALAPALRPIGGIRTSMVTTMHCADGTAVHDRS
jgi:hypothetical protein